MPPSSTRMKRNGRSSSRPAASSRSERRLIRSDHFSVARDRGPGLDQLRFHRLLRIRSRRPRKIVVAGEPRMHVRKKPAIHGLGTCRGVRTTKTANPGRGVIFMDVLHGTWGSLGESKAFSSEVETGSRQENASNQESRAPFRFYRNGALVSIRGQRWASGLF